ncbi:MAG: GGDEF domain-containing protein [Methylophilaceae bacterium]
MTAMIASLDFRTMLFMASLLAIALSLLLLAIRSRTTTLNGLKEWLYANVLIGVAILTFILYLIPINIRAFVGGLFMVSGFILCFTAILLFENRKFKLEMPKYSIYAIIAINILIELMPHSLYVSVVFNTLLCAIFTFCSGVFLLKYSRYKTSKEHRFTGLFFLLFSGLTVFRMFILTENAIRPIDELTSWELNEITFLACLLSLLAINFGFIAMVYEKLAEQLSYAAKHDWLTGMLNRGNLEVAAAQMTTHSVRFEHTQAMLLMDLDKFKRINDTYGHLFGDEVIKTLANLLGENIREIDFVGRYGGEEFCVLMPNTNEAAAMVSAERIRKKFQDSPILLEGKKIQCTVSIGVCDSSEVGREFKDMFAAADRALYAAKRAGRNRVIGFSAAPLMDSATISDADKSITMPLL